MTVPYAANLPPKFSFSGWCQNVVCVWKGGVYKLIRLELAVFTILWYAGWGIMTNFTFQKNINNDIYIQSFRTYQGTIRLMLGFMLVYYYQEIYARARRIFFAIPFPDSTFVAINSVIGRGPSKNDRSSE